MYHKPQKNASLQHITKFVRQSTNEIRYILISKHQLQITILAFLLIFSFAANAEVLENPEDPVQVSFGKFDDYLLDMTFNKNQYAFFVWTSNLTNNWNPDLQLLKIQKLDSSGEKLWQTNGICFTLTNQSNQAIVLSDSNNGCDVIYRKGKYYNGKIYFQHFDTDGNISYPLPGKPIAITTETNSQTHAVAIRLANSNLFCCWYNGSENEGNDYLYGQLFDINGNYLWQSNGIQLLSQKLGGRSDDARPAVCESGTDIVVVVQTLLDDDSYDLYAQRINKNGFLMWGIGGVPVCTVSNRQEYVSAASDISNNTIFVWNELRRGTNINFYDIYAQCLDSIGSNLWQINGVPLTDTTITI